MEEDQYNLLQELLREAMSAFRELRITVAEDAPYGDGAIFVERMADRIDDILGWLGEMSDLVSNCLARRSLGDERECLRKALAFGQSQTIRIASMFAEELISYNAIRELRRLGRRRGSEWTAWGYSVEQGFEGCRAPLDALQKGFVTAWQEMTRQSSAKILVSNTNVGFANGRAAHEV